jgi:hypothetical protein
MLQATGNVIADKYGDYRAQQHRYADKEQTFLRADTIGA